MKTISSHVREIILNRPVLKEVIQKDLGNLSAIARSIKDDIQSRTDELVSESSIIMALHRLRDELQRNESSNTQSSLLKAIKALTMQSDIVVYNLKELPDGDTLRKLDESGELLTATKGLWNHTVIVRQELKSTTDLNSNYFSKTDGLSAITFQFEGVNYEAVGLVSFILGQITSLGAPIVEVASSLGELTVILREDLTIKVFDHFHKLLRD